LPVISSSPSLSHVQVRPSYASVVLWSVDHSRLGLKARRMARVSSTVVPVIVVSISESKLGRDQ
jgi:hypothetical protein